MIRGAKRGNNLTMSLLVRSFGASDIGWAETLMEEFAGRLQARLGEVVDTLACPGFVAEINGERCGIAMFTEGELSVEVVYIETTVPHHGVGTALISEVVERARGKRVWLVTTNDNLDALRFYQRRGFRLAELRAGAVDETRRHLKPSIPAIGNFGIPIRDEIVLELKAEPSG
jgi:GNAT superfamily N-acetyltransferase